MTLFRVISGCSINFWFYLGVTAEMSELHPPAGGPLKTNNFNHMKKHWRPSTK